MSTYQVAVLFNTNDQSVATELAEHIQLLISDFQNKEEISDAKISFVKFEKEAAADE